MMGCLKMQQKSRPIKLIIAAATNSLRPGDMKFKDISGPDGKPDGKITTLDQVRLDKTRDPKFTAGFNLNVSYKTFDLSALFQGAAGGFSY